LIRWPGVAKAGHVDKHLTSLLDLAPTFLEAAGLPPDPHMQGRSLVPLLRGQAVADWRKSFYYHYFEYPVPHRVRPHYGVVTERYKLVHFYKPDVDEWELLDREKDPLETRNFYNDPAYAEVVRELKAELQRLRRELKEPDELPKEAYGALYFPPKKKK
jgi:arylsulfatase A-like enzyme